MAYLTLRRRPARQGTVGQRATYGPGLIEGGGDVLLADSSQLVRQVTVVKRLPRVSALSPNASCHAQRTVAST